MDMIPLLRSFREDAPEVDEARLRPIRARLEDHIAASVRRPRTRRRRSLTATALVAAAVGVAVAAAVVLVPPAPGASAEAAQLLGTAAARAGAGADGGRTVVLLSEGLSMAQDEAGAVTAAYLARSTVTLEVPAGEGRWTRTTVPHAPRVFYGDGRALAEREGAFTASAPLVEHSDDGDFTVGELGGRDPRAFDADPASFARLPRDPDALLRVLQQARLGAAEQGPVAEHVLQAASEVLGSGAAGPAVQAAVFTALQRQPGVVVSDAALQVDGRQAVAVGASPARGATDRHELLLDRSTGAYLGDRDVALAPQGVVPAGALLAMTTLEQR